MSKPLRISPIALNETNQKVLKVAVGLINDEGINARLLPEGNPLGHVLVIDGDSEAGRQALAEAREGQVKLVMSETRCEGKNVIWHETPVRVADMHELLSRICLRIIATLASQAASEEAREAARAEEDKAQPVADTDAESPPPSPTSDETPTLGDGQKVSKLFHLLLEAKIQQTCYRISQGEHLLLVGGYNDSFAADEGSIAALLDTPAERLTVEQIDIVAFAKEAQNLNIQALNALLWQAGVDHSDGRLLAGHDSNHAVRLRAWPNFTRNGFRQSHFRLAAIMARQPISLKALRKEADVSQSEVNDFYNACYAVGLIERRTDDAAGETVQERRKRAPRSSGLLGKLARKLGFR